MSELTGKTIVITGASRGIGAAAGRYLAAQGAHVVLAARSKDAIEALAAELNAVGQSALAVGCDVADYAAVADLIAQAETAFGPVDVLVNNAGLIDPIAHLADSDPGAWDLVVDVNLKGVYHGMRAVLPSMLARQSGTIINISSGAASGALEGWSHYCATKAAVLSLTRCADKEYRDQGITVVGLSPGTVATEMQVSIKASGINPVSQLDPSVHIPAEWVGQAIGFLSTDAAREFAGTDFTLKTDAERAKAGLPPVGAPT